ncbi:MAG TPA: hypothetical protein VMM76_28610 [Pirellulaceae bacterium]|nr:hypothetical protein [Pirellulaceae bacterium]
MIDTTNSPSIQQTGIADGQFFTIDDGISLTTFEFDSDQAPGIVTPGRIRIAFGANDSANQLGNALVAAVNISNVRLDPLRRMINLGSGLLDAGEPAVNSLPHLWDTTGTNLRQTGVSGGIRDGETFQITLVDNSGFPLNTVTIELDRNGIQTAGNVIVVFGDTSTAGDIANTMVPVLLSAGLGLNAVHNGLGTLHSRSRTTRQARRSPSSSTTLAPERPWLGTMSPCGLRRAALWIKLPTQSSRRSSLFRQRWGISWLA